jgi:hypothetical protein
VQEVYRENADAEGEEPVANYGPASTEEFIARHAGALSDDFPDDIDDSAELRPGEAEEIMIRVPE